MEKISLRQIGYEGRQVGRMALYNNQFGVFEYGDEWIAEGFSLKPYSLPLVKKVFIPKLDLFDGLYGGFLDSYQMVGEDYL